MKEKIIENEEFVEEIQTTFNEDGLDVLCEDATVENEYKDGEENANENN